MKNKEKNGLRDIYRFYSGSHKKYEEAANYKIFAKVIRSFNEALSNMMIEKGVEFVMPDRLGSLRIRKYKIPIRFDEQGNIIKKNLGVDWKKTWELWAKEYPDIPKEKMKDVPGKPLVYHLNEHSDGYKVYLYWNKKGSNAKNKGVFSFIFSESNIRHLANVIRSTNRPEYYE